MFDWLGYPNTLNESCAEASCTEKENKSNKKKFVNEVLIIKNV